MSNCYLEGKVCFGFCRLYSDVPVFANLRCGLWYAPNADDTCYFKVSKIFFSGNTVGDCIIFVSQVAINSKSGTRCPSFSLLHPTLCLINHWGFSFELIVSYTHTFLGFECVVQSTDGHNSNWSFSCTRLNMVRFTSM